MDTAGKTSQQATVHAGTMGNNRHQQLEQVLTGALAEGLDDLVLVLVLVNSADEEAHIWAVHVDLEHAGTIHMLTVQLQGDKRCC